MTSNAPADLEQGAVVLGDAAIRELVTEAAREFAQSPRRSGLYRWCAEHGVNHAHLNEFMNGKRGPQPDMLAALGLKRAVVRKTTFRNAARGADVPADVARLVVAARKAAYEMPDVLIEDIMIELDAAAEAFASRVPWDDEPEDMPTPQPGSGSGAREAIARAFAAYARDLGPLLADRDVGVAHTAFEAGAKWAVRATGGDQ